MRFRPLAGLLIVALHAACGGSTTVVSIKSPGSGGDLVTRLPFSDAARWTYAISDSAPANGSQYLSDSYFEGTVLLNGVRCGRYVTELEVAYYEQTPDAYLYWGTDNGDVFATPLTTLSFPLRLGREWVTGDAEHPDWYRYLVSAVEPIQTPAGTFDAARVDMLNTRTQERVSRWYADGVGMVQRWGYSDLDGTVVSTVLLRFNREGATP